MKFFSVDVETTGLDHLKDQVVQIGAVYVDSQLPLEIIYEEANRFSQIIHYDRLTGHPAAFHMHNKTKIIEAIANRKDTLSLDEAMKSFFGWMYMRNNGKAGSIVPAGKNFAGFDRWFLQQHASYVRFKHRTLDPGPVFSLTTDEEPPDLKTCCERANVHYDEHLAHEALYDAERVAILMWKHLNRDT